MSKKRAKRIRKQPSKSNGEDKEKRSRFKPVSDKIVPRRKPRLMVKARQQIVLEMYAAGRTPEQIAVKMDMRLQDVTRDINTAIDELVVQYSKPSPQQTFVRYATFQLAIIRKLNHAIEAFRKDEDTKQYNAWVSALRTQSDIYDKVYQKGYEYGVIPKKKADRKALEGGADLRAELRTEITMIQGLLDEIDDATQRKALKGRAIQTKITYAVRVRKPLRNSFGIIRAIPDWKYRQAVYDDRGHPVPYDELSQEQKRLVAHQDMDDRLHKELSKSPIDRPMHKSKRKVIPSQETKEQPQPTHKGRYAVAKSRESSDWIVKPRVVDLEST